jgi:hypothetical protein
MDKRVKAIAMLREWLKEEIESINKADNAVQRVVRKKTLHKDLMTTVNAVVFEFRKQHAPAGCRYWEIYSDRAKERRHEITAAGEELRIDRNIGHPVEITHNEFLARQDIRFNYDDESL